MFLREQEVFRCIKKYKNLSFKDETMYDVHTFAKNSLSLYETESQMFCYDFRMEESLKAINRIIEIKIPLRI